MKIVLLENVKKLGKKDEVVEISDGYARNMIIPKGLGIPATPENLNNLKLKNKNEAKKEENLSRIAEENKELIEKEAITFKIKTGGNGKAFGSITNKEVADALYNKTKLSVDKKDVLLEDTIKNVGKYIVKIKLHKDIVANLNVNVEEE